MINFTCRNPVVLLYVSGSTAYVTSCFSTEELGFSNSGKSQFSTSVLLSASKVTLKSWKTGLTESSWFKAITCRIRHLGHSSAIRLFSSYETEFGYDDTKDGRVLLHRPDEVGWGPSSNSESVQECRMYVVQPRRNGPKYRLDQHRIPLEVRYARHQNLISVGLALSFPLFIRAPYSPATG